MRSILRFLPALALGALFAGPAGATCTGVFPANTVCGVGAFPAIPGPVAIPTTLPPNGSASGDLSGSYPGPAVAKVQGLAYKSGATYTAGQVPTWNATNSDFEPGSGGGGGGLSPIAAETLLGNNTLGSATPSALTVAQVKALLGGLAPSVIDYGADPTHAADSATAFQNAFTAAAASSPGGGISIPCGNYKLLSAVPYTIPNPGNVTVFGGGQECAVVDFTTSDGFVSTHAGNSSSESWFNLSVVSGGTTHTAFSLSMTTNVIGRNNAQNTFRNISTRGDDCGYGCTNYWWLHYNVTTVGAINWDSDILFGTGSGNGEGIEVQGTATGCSGPCYGVQYNISESEFSLLYYGIWEQAYVQGITVNQSNFNGDTFGILVASGAVGLGQLSVFNSQFGQSPVLIQANEAGGAFIGNYFLPSSSQVALTFSSTLMSFIGNLFNGTSSTVAIQCFSGSLYNAISGNVFNEESVAVNLNSGCNSNNVQANVYNNVTTQVNNWGSGNSVGVATK
jgi:hypothetical protein